MNLIKSFFAAIQEFFESLFFSGSPEYRKKKELKELFTSLKTIKPLIYREKTLLPAFGMNLYELYTMLKPLKEILENSIASIDITTNEKYQSLFFEAVMQPEQKKQLRSLHFDTRNAELTECGTYNDAEKKIQQQQERFQSFISIFEDNVFKSSEELLINLLTLGDLCSFDYSGFLWHFNRDLEIKETTQVLGQNDFNDVFGEDVLQNLLDLQFILNRIQIDKYLIAPLIFLAKKLPDFDNNSEHAINKSIERLSQFFSTQLKKDSILIILKLIKNDPDFEENASFSESRPLHDYITRLQESFQANTRRLSAIQKDVEITSLIKQCFGTSKLKMINGYNETMNTSLQKVVPTSFEWVRPMELIKSFTDDYFAPRYKGFLQDLLIEGVFTTKQTEAKYASVYRSCQPLQGRLYAFEQLFQPHGPCSEQEIQGYIAAIEKGLDVNKKLIKIIDTANTQAKILIQTASKNYMDLYTLIGLLLEDVKAHYPQFITNLKQMMHSDKNKESFAYLQKDYSFFGEFLNIMKNYAIFSSMNQPENRKS